MRRIGRLALVAVLAVAPLVAFGPSSSAAPPTLPYLTITPVHMDGEGGQFLHDGETFTVHGAGCGSSDAARATARVYVTITSGGLHVDPAADITVAVTPDLAGRWSVTSRAIYGLGGWGFDWIGNQTSIDAVCDTYNASVAYQTDYIDVYPTIAAVTFPDAADQAKLSVTLGASTRISGSWFLAGEKVAIIAGSSYCGPDEYSQSNWLESEDVIATFRADGSGRIAGRFSIPLDFPDRTRVYDGFCLVGETSFRGVGFTPTLVVPHAVAPPATSAVIPATPVATAGPSTSAVTASTTNTSVAALANTGLAATVMLCAALFLTLSGAGLTIAGRRRGPRIQR